MTTRAGSDRLDDAARAGWLYYIAGRTQEEIAARLGVSRQAAQRLVRWRSPRGSSGSASIIRSAGAWISPPRSPIASG